MSAEPFDITSWHNYNVLASANQEMANKEMQLEAEREKKRKKEETAKLKAQQRAEVSRKKWSLRAILFTACF